MGLLEPHSQSFIVKVWVEHGAGGTDAARWRGHVTNVMSGKRVYTQRLDELPLIIMPCLQSMGIHFGTLWRARQWLYRSRRAHRA